jgi:polyribonucleotide nucleotidyltransferase
MEDARARIMAIVSPAMAEVGATYMGKVVNITKFGAFVNILPGRDGLVHISKLGRGKRINSVEDVLQLGQEIEVVVEEIDEKGKVSLTPSASWGGSGDGGSDDQAPPAARSNGSSDSAPAPTRAETVSFDDAFDAELVSEFGDLGPGGEAGGNDKGGDRGPRRDDRNGRGARGGAARRHR